MEPHHLTYIHVQGDVDASSPTVMRGFRPLAHAIVENYARSEGAKGTSTAIQLCRDLIDSFTGKSTTLPNVRDTSEGWDLTSISVDDIVDTLASSRTKLEKMYRILQDLNRLADKKLIPKRRAEGVARVCLYATWQWKPCVDEFRSWDISDMRRDDLMKRATAAILEKSQSTLLVWFDHNQVQFFDKMASRSGIPNAVADMRKRSLGFITIREFLVKEKLAHGLPITDCLAANVGWMRQQESVYSMHGLLQHFNGSSLATTLAKVCRTPVQEVIDRGVSRRVENMLNLKGTSRADIQPIKGGHVMEPETGMVCEETHILDFCSLYPSIIQAYDVRKDIGIPNSVRSLVEMRRQHALNGDEIGANACKIMANAVYGQLGNPRSKCYSPSDASIITGAGRKHWQDLCSHLESRGCRVLYGDTDSCLLTNGSMSVSMLRESYNESLPVPMKISHQDTFSACIILGKKRYIGLRPDASVCYSGTVNTRADVPEVVKDAYQSIARDILNGCSLENLKHSIERVLKKIECEPMNRFASVSRLKSLGECARNAPYACDLALRELMRDPGLAYSNNDSIRYIVCKINGKTSFERPEESDSKYLDRSYYIDLLTRALKKLVEVCYVEGEMICFPARKQPDRFMFKD